MLDTELNDLARKFREIENGQQMQSTIIAPDEPARVEACITTTTELLPWPTGRLFVDATMEPSAKPEAKSMVSGILNAFYELVDENPWLDDETTKLAKEKAKAISQFIAYPDFLTDNSQLDKYFGQIPQGEAYFTSYLNIKAANVRSNLASWKTPDSVPATDWLSGPGVVNAFYSGQLNSITVPGGILQDPFFYPGRPTSINYGAIGAIIGHEVTHGFDNNGRQFDKDGNQRQWWPDKMIKEFERRSQCYVGQYDQYCPEELNGTICVDGKQTLGENIADNGGVRETYRGYRDWVLRQNGGKEEARLPGFEQFTPDQLLFIGYAINWCGADTPKGLDYQIKNDEHSPRRYRVFGPLSNSVEFRDTFKCPVGDMNRGGKSCVLW